MGIEILPPDLNASQLRFAPESRSTGERHPLRAGRHQELRRGRDGRRHRRARGQRPKFASLEDFSTRLDSKVVNKRILENLVKAGALDWTGETRAGMFNRLEQVVASASSAQRDKAAGQVSLFDAMEFAAPAQAAKSGRNETPVEEWSKDDRLAHEKELLGFYVTGHPLDKFRGVIDSEKYKRLGLLDDLDFQPARAFPLRRHDPLARSKDHQDRQALRRAVLEDFTGSAEIMLWGETFVPAREAGC
jgi:DNA polymerase III subunit alpha